MLRGACRVTSRHPAAEGGPLQSNGSSATRKTILEVSNQAAVAKILRRTNLGGIVEMLRIYVPVGL